MNACVIAIKNTVRRHVRDITPFIMQVMSTIILIVIFGSMFKGNFNADAFINPVKVTIVNEDNGQFSKQFIDFLNSKSLNKLIRVTAVSNLDAAKQSLQEGKYDGVIEIMNKYSEGYMQGNFDGIETFMINNDKTTYQILSSILNGWKNNSAAIQIGLRAGQSMDDITNTIQNTGKGIIEMPLLSNGSIPKAIDYFSVTMVVMTLIFSGFNAMGRLQQDFLSDMKIRFECAPVHIGNILTGILLATTLMSFLQMVFVVAFTHFVYGANWGNNLGIVFGTLFLLTLLGQMFAGALTLGMRNANAPQAIVGSAAMGLEFLAGGFYVSPIKGSLGKFLLTYGTPNSLAQTAIFGSIYGGSSQIIYLCMSILAGLSIIFLALTILFAKRRLS